VVHRWSLVLLVVDFDFTAGEFDVAGVVALVVFEDGHEAEAAGFLEMLTDGKVVDGQIAVAVEDVEGVAEFRKGLDEGAAGAEELRAVERILDFDAPLRAVAVEFDDFFAEVADAKHNLGETGFLQEADLVEKNGSSATSMRSLGTSP